jgi:conjugative relaxase-like TrwC/TraI family protein
MLSISVPMKGSTRADYFLNLAREDYYTKSLETPGQWSGQGATLLGLKGQVEGKQFISVLNGLSPDGTRALVQKPARGTRQTGWDLTFSAPKSVSVFWSQATESSRAAVDRAHHAAVEHALSYLEDVAGITRRGKGGKVWEKVALTFALFQHSTSRKQDPQLHTHAILINTGVRQDGTTGALWSKEFFKEKMTAGALYQMELGAQLREHLGLVSKPAKYGIYLTDVPLKLCDEFSKRRKDIEAQLQTWGETSAVAAKLATLATRPAKNQLPRAELFAIWGKVGQAHGWSREQASQLVNGDAKRKEQNLGICHWYAASRAAKNDGAELLKDVVRNGFSVARDLQVDPTTLIAAAHMALAEPKRKFVRGERTKVFPKAPPWSRLKKHKLPTLVVGHPKAANKVLWKKGFAFAELQVIQKSLGKDSSIWKPVRLLGLPRLRIELRSQQTKSQSEKSEQTKNQSQDSSSGKKADECPMEQYLRWVRTAIFPKSPDWMRLKKLKLPTLMVGRPNRVLWKKILAFGELQIYERPLHVDGILRTWIPAHIRAVPALRLQKTGQPSQSQSQANGKNHSH